MVDLLDYLKGDGRLYELVNNLGSNEITQTHVEPGNVFYTVKNVQWEELWWDDVFIYRGTDTSPGGINIYILSENNHYGSAWVPRWFEVGQLFKRSAMVMWRKKSDGSAVPDQTSGVAVTYLRLERIYTQLTFQSGIQLQDVAELHAYVDDGGRPASSPWEKYFYAKGFGLVGFEDMYGGFKSWIAQKFTPKTMTPRVREVIPWLIPLQKRYYLPAAPSLTATGEFVLSKMPSDWVNVRNYPNGYAKDIGDLHTNDQVTLFAPEVSGWVNARFGTLQGWVYRQGGKVEFTSTDAEPSPLPDLSPVGQYTLTQIPSSWINVRDYPNESGQDIGDLHKGDVVTLFTPEQNGWVYVDAGSQEGWVYRQEGKVVFTPVSTTPVPPIPPDEQPTLPKVSSIGDYVLLQIPSSWVNVRTYPADTGADVGDLRKGDVVTMYTPQVNGWVFVKRGDMQGWVSLQDGRVAFTPAVTDSPIPHDDLPPLPQIQPAGRYSVSQIPGTWINIRAYPDTIGADVGDLHVGDVVTLYKPEVNGWVFVETLDIHGWVSRQDGRVTFETAPPASGIHSEQSNGTAKALEAPAWAATLPEDVPEFSEHVLEIAVDPEAEIETEPVESVVAPEDEEDESPVAELAQAGAGVLGRVRSGLGKIMSRKKEAGGSG